MRTHARTETGTTFLPSSFSQGPGSPDALVAPLLSVRNLNVEFDTPQGVFRAVDDLSFDVSPGRTLAIVGESGSGKSVTSMAIMRLTDYNRGRIASGQVMFRSRDGTVLDMTQAEPSTLLRMRGNEMSMIFQEPMTSLNPVFTVGNQIVETHYNFVDGQLVKIAERIVTHL